jgi:hypothetical protein
MKKNFNSKIIRYKLFFAFAAIVVVMIQCKQSNEQNIPITDSANAETNLVSVSETIIPDAAGAEDFKANCLTCHSARYVQMQPGLPKKTWEKIVNKMITSYGAPISDSAAKKIVDYLALVKK